jgi:hypothetical protein
VLEKFDGALRHAESIRSVILVDAKQSVFNGSSVRIVTWNPKPGLAIEEGISSLF